MNSSSNSSSSSITQDMAAAANSGAASVGSGSGSFDNESSSVSAAGATAIGTNNASAHLDEHGSTQTAEECAVHDSPGLAIGSGKSKNAQNSDDDESSSGHDKSPQSDDAHAVGAAADCAVIRAIAEDGYDDNSGDESSEQVHQLLHSSSSTKSTATENTSRIPILMPIFDTLGFEGDDEPGRGGAQEDSASIDISAITTPHTLLARLGNGNIEENVEEEKEGNALMQHSNTASVTVVDDKTGEVSAYVNDQMSEGISADAEGDPFRGEIGSILKNAMHNLDPNMLEGYLLDLTKSSEIPSSEIAKKSIRLGELAFENAAFDAAAIYFKAGRGLLGPKWEESPNAMLQLCTEGASACFIAGDIEMTNALVEDVLRRDVPIREKFRAYEVKILLLQASQRFDEAITTALDIRRQLGLKSPANKATSTATTLKEYIKTRRALKKLTSNDIVALPDLEDERIVMGQRLLELLIPSTYQVQPTLFPLVVFLLVRTSIKHGINASSCDAFACYGLLLCAAFGKFDEGEEMARTVELLLRKPGMQRMKSRSFYILEGFIRHWTCPLRATRGPLLNGYRVGLETGDVESAAFNISLRCCKSWFAYHPLVGLQNELEDSMSVLVQLNQRSHERNLQAYLLVVRRLRNIDSEDETNLGFEELMKADEESSVNVFYTVKLMQLELFVLFRDWEGALLCLTEAPDIRTRFLGLYASVRATFLEALVYLKASSSATSWLARQKWKRKAIKSIKMLTCWMKKGNPNIRHYMHILRGERYLLEGNGRAAEKNFLAAITAAKDGGFLHDQALSHDLASACYRALGKGFMASFHFECSQRIYVEWGATSKAETQYIYYN